METMELWAVKVIADCEGRTSKVVARFSNEQAAVEFAESDAGLDMYKNKGRCELEQYSYYNNANEHPDYSKSEIKKAALAKLSPVELRALGIGA